MTQQNRSRTNLLKWFEESRKKLNETRKQLRHQQAMVRRLQIKNGRKWKPNSSARFYFELAETQMNIVSNYMKFVALLKKVDYEAYEKTTEKYNEWQMSLMDIGETD